jgi:hypothetical protein
MATTAAEEAALDDGTLRGLGQLGLVEGKDEEEEAEEEEEEDEGKEESKDKDDLSEERVWGNPDLLERVLSFLPTPCDLCRAAAVSKAFRAAGAVQVECS